MQYFVFVSLLFASLQSLAQTTEIETVRVIGLTPQSELSKPNSAHVISSDKVEQQQQTDANRVLKQVPGVYIQEEDGLGLRPNIGLRGTHPHRSRKVVILEDGILIGPAPYSAPAAYYTPFMSKIESLEVFKGVASVPYGPNSIGGAVNYITRSIPSENTKELDLAGGSFDYRKLRVMGSQNISETSAVLIEAARVETTGFKKIDNGESSGFAKNDVLLKGRHLISENMQQELSWKLGYADEDSDETYLGLSLEDFKANPYRRYAASQVDEMVWDHKQAQLSYKLNPSESLGVWATAYYHSFHRNWSRLNNFAGGSAPSISDVLKDPTTPANQLYYQVLTGQADSSGSDDLIIANNNRYFFSQGLQLNSVLFVSQSELQHQIKTSLRLHQDQIKRRHTESRYLMRSGKMEINGAAPTPTTTNRDTSTAKTLAVEDEISFGANKVTLAARVESINYESINESSGSVETREESLFVPGVGYFRQLSERVSAFTGINKGFTVVGPNDDESTKPEESINLEAGLRYQNSESEFFAELIGFKSYYSNIKGTCSFSAGCTSNQLDTEFDGGEAEVTGIESRFAQLYTWGAVYFPISLNVTVTNAVFTSTTSTSNPEWGNGTIRSGDPLPYIPQANYSFNIGTQYKQWSQELVLTWTGKMYDQAVAQGREEIAAHGVVDWSGRYNWSRQGALYARIDNLFDNEYLVSLRPFGARPGKDRALQLGLKYRF